MRGMTAVLLLCAAAGALLWTFRTQWALSASSPDPAAVQVLQVAQAPEGGARATALTAVSPGQNPTPEVPEPAEPIPTSVERLAPHYGFIAASQMESGAIAMTPKHLLINPYFANLAALSMLTRPEEHLPAVTRWMDWYIAHLNDDGTIDDYRVEEGLPVATGKYDSADSYAATFLSVINAYLHTGGDPAWVIENRSDLDRIAGVIEDLTDKHGLTYAKRLYPLRLLMDNAEVAAGWDDWAEVLLLIGDDAGARAARDRADRVRDGLALFRQDDGAYAWALAPLGLKNKSDVKRFYPDAVAQLFPFAFGMTDDAAGYQRFTEAHPAWTDLRSDQFPWLFVAYAAARAGDWERLSAALESVQRSYSELSPPWYVTESAWLIRAVLAVPAAPAAPGPLSPE